MPPAVRTFLEAEHGQARDADAPLADEERQSLEESLLVLRQRLLVARLQRADVDLQLVDLFLVARRRRRLSRRRCCCCRPRAFRLFLLLVAKRYQSSVRCVATLPVPSISVVITSCHCRQRQLPVRGVGGCLKAITTDKNTQTQKVDLHNHTKAACTVYLVRSLAGRTRLSSGSWHRLHQFHFLLELHG